MFHSKEVFYQIVVKGGIDGFKNRLRIALMGLK